LNMTCVSAEALAQPHSKRPACASLAKANVIIAAAAIAAVCCFIAAAILPMSFPNEIALTD